MTYTTTVTKTVTPKDIYGGKDLSKDAILDFLVAHNLQIIDFRPPVLGDMWLGTFSVKPHIQHGVPAWFKSCSTEPRLIVKHIDNVPSANWWDDGKK